MTKEMKIIIKLTKVDRLHYIHEKVVKENKTKPNMVNKAFCKHEQLWHRRLALLNMPNVNGFIGAHETEDESDPIKVNCQICYEGKMERSPFPKIKKKIP
ncbi:hypothetical protein JTB14_002140 [Gonioctena quinquepunctata]|nr:hypothetical protein JTB14_002140 [Gonioctena quinquepunctata]